MATNRPRRGDDLTPLEGGATGGGAGGARSSVTNTKWSNLPSFESNASIMDDVRKLTKDTSHLKGGAKKATELAEDRAAARMAVRVGGTGLGIAGHKYFNRDAVADDTSKKSDDSEDTSGNAVRTNDPVGAAGTGMKKGGSVSSASKRADGCATKGKTKGRFV